MLLLRGRSKTYLSGTTFSARYVPPYDKDVIRQFGQLIYDPTLNEYVANPAANNINFPTLPADTPTVINNSHATGDT